MAGFESCGVDLSDLSIVPFFGSRRELAWIVRKFPLVLSPPTADDAVAQAHAEDWTSQISILLLRRANEFAFKRVWPMFKGKARTSRREETENASCTTW